MKKLFTLMLVIALCFAVVGCGDSSSGGEPKATDTQNQEQEVETAYPIVLADTDLVNFAITDYDEIWEEYSYTVQNKTDKDINFSVDKVVANGEYTVDAWIYAEVGAGTKATDSFYLDSQAMDNFEDGETVTLEFTYSLIDNNTFDTITEGTFKMEITK